MKNFKFIDSVGAPGDILHLNFHTSERSHSSYPIRVEIVSQDLEILPVGNLPPYREETFCYITFGCLCSKSLAYTERGRLHLSVNGPTTKEYTGISVSIAEMANIISAVKELNSYYSITEGKCGWEEIMYNGI